MIGEISLPISDSGFLPLFLFLSNTNHSHNQLEIFTMKSHLSSFIKAPIGYLFNFVAHFDFLSGRFVCWGCETFCLRDGIQDDCWF
jgi:hypothetical protein